MPPPPSLSAFINCDQKVHFINGILSPLSLHQFVADDLTVQPAVLEAGMEAGVLCHFHISLQSCLHLHMLEDFSGTAVGLRGLVRLTNALPEGRAHSRG